MKITLDQEKCIGCGTCAAMCPEIFVMDNETSKAKVIKNDGCATCDAAETAKSCPVEAIIISNA
ncbi:MAG: ferredoxin [Patescibacteria group bacterium]|nr:ferredoxin [Patescibacteria group bacterium]